ncbi:hypothetical protein HNP84_000299 [Thermocatellispora tengchongensis]|uniref:DUF4407 domain-containing protein n=1 Tax=Thermocatellispora tengchongensis TaxID=1073253 RepID=A0A840NY73_9ACTN|nr:DUF4407 domain-containing protein [Thermocatellispora tengchongensis]MBB5130611.1 hypothetical protein [Thermocatellispora tengchongensis]
MTEAPPSARGRRLDLGRRLRVLAGVDERVLDQVPLERTRYTGLGGVVLGTAVMAGMSMWFALSQVLGGANVLMVVPVVIWALIVLNLDRWLVSTVAGMWQRRLLMLVPRLLVAVLLGSILAEPLVLRVFDTAIVQHVKDGRQDARDRLRARLVECNPQPPATPARADCGGDSRLLATTPEAMVAEMARMKRDLAALDKRIKTVNERHERLVDQATDECAGRDGRGLSGKRGYGPLCKRLQQQANQVLATSGVEQDKAKREELEDRIAAMNGTLADRQAGYQKAVQDAIDKRVAALPDPAQPVGMLERMRALDELTGDDAYLATGSWLLRLFLIMIDCLPLLVKLMGGTTAYDRMVAEENRRREAVHAKRVSDEADDEIGELDLLAHAKAERRRMRRQEIELERKAADVANRARLEDMINRRTNELRLRGVHEGSRNGAFTPN